MDVEYVAQETITQNPDGSIASTRFYDPHAVRDDLLDRAKLTVQTEIDLALEAHGQPPKYYAGIRYKVIESYVHNLVVVAPVEYEMPDDFFQPDFRHTGVRYQVAWDLAKKASVLRQGCEIFDMSLANTPPWIEKEKLAEEEEISDLIQPDKELPHISD
ncbi:MAG: hypothetical protein JRI53_04485 [Deltaproteobacteria bacterium]|nr:hypothetical protein [Deltaproteobacteria bacterium]